MEESHRHHHRHHHHQHHGYDTNYGPEGHSNATSAQSAINYNQIVVGGQQQQYQDILSQQTTLLPNQIFYIPPDQTLSGVETTGSFHSVSSADSSAEMSKYFPDVQTPSMQTFSSQQVQGQARSKAIPNTLLTTNTVHAGPYTAVFASSAVQQLSQPIQAPLMAQPQQPNRPSQLPQGIPSHSSQIEGLSVSQAVINDVLVDLQSKVINETLQQYHNEASGGNYLEPLPPIYIRAPQPTIILRSDLNRLRAELGSRVRPPVVYRYPTDSNQFQQQGFQQQFQQNTFQAPRFPAPPHQFIPQGHYGPYQNPIFASDEYKVTATATTGDGYRKEEEERLYSQAESPALNVNNINDNVHSAFDLQGLSTASFDRYASPYQSTSFIPNLKQQQQQQGIEETVLTSSHNFNNEEVGGIDNMFSSSGRSRQEVSFDIDNCILRCFESHRQRVARRKAARQARRARRHKQSEQQQYQQVYNTDIYQNVSNQPTYPSFGILEQTPWQQQTSFAQHYSDTTHVPTTTSTSVYVPQGQYMPTEAYDYSNTIQSSSGINTHTGQIPFSTLSTSNTNTALSNDQQISATDYYQFQTNNVQESYVPANTFEYASHQTVPSTFNSIQQSSTGYSNQLQYPPFTTADTAVSGGIQHLIPGNDQLQQQIPTQSVQNQGDHTQSSSTFHYGAESTQSQIPTYNYQNVGEQFSSEYPYNLDSTQEQSSFDYSTIASTAYTPAETDLQQTGYNYSVNQLNQAPSSSHYYQQQKQPVLISAAQSQGTYGQPTGTVEYTRESYQSQEPIYDYQGATNQQTSQYSHDTGHTQQLAQQSAYDYTNVDAGIYAPSQVQESYVQSSETFGFPTGSIQSQQPAYDYQNVEQISSQYPYNIQNIEQQQGFPETNFSQADHQQSTDYLNQTFSSSDHYEQQPVSISVSRDYDAQLRDQRLDGGSIPTGTVEYTRQAYFSQEPLLNNYTTERFLEQQQQRQEHEENEPLSVNDYLKRFETEPYQQQTGGQIKSSDDIQSISTMATTPFIIQQQTDTYTSQGATQSYNLENYTNESVVPGTTTAATQPPLHSSSYYEEDQQRLLQQDYIGEPKQDQFQQSEQYSEKDVSSYNTYSSLPPPPPPLVGGIDYHQESIATNVSDFPAPPTPDHHAYQMAQQRTNRTFPSVIPSTDQAGIYGGKQPESPSSSDHDTDDAKEEAEEAFDLRQCIARCYAKYQNQWNQEQQRQYQTQVGEQPPTTNVTSSFNNGYREQAQQFAGRNEIHYNEGWTQTPVADITQQSQFAQHTYDQTSSNFDTKSHGPQLHSTDLAADSREQQTIEYSPPLIIQARQTNPTMPSSNYEYTRFEHHEQQPIYDHTLPLPPHLSFNDNEYHSNVYLPSSLPAQPRQNENTSSYVSEQQQQQQQRYRAHSEPASIQQEATVTIPSLQPSSSQTFERQSRRTTSIPMIHQRQQQRSQTQMPEYRFLDNGRVYETEATFERRIPRIDPKTGLCLVPCPQAIKYAHLPPHLRPELFCIELPPPSSLPPVPPPPPPPPPSQMQHQRYCVRCCCVPGRSLIKKIVYREAEEGHQQAEESQYDYAAVIDKLATQIRVRYGNSIMEEGDAFVTGNYNERLRIIDFPVYVSGQNNSNLTPLIPVN